MILNIATNTGFTSCRDNGRYSNFKVHYIVCVRIHSDSTRIHYILFSVSVYCINQFLVKFSYEATESFLTTYLHAKLIVLAIHLQAKNPFDNILPSWVNLFIKYLRAKVINRFKIYLQAVINLDSYVCEVWGDLIVLTVICKLI